METEYGKSSHKDHQIFTIIQVALLCPVDVVEFILVNNSILKHRFTVCSCVEAAPYKKGNRAKS